MQDRKGFTLIELLIVVVIIGILAAIAVPKFSATREKAYVAAMKSDLRNIASQQELYYADNTYVYASTTTALNFSPSSGVTLTFASGGATGWSATAVHSALTGTVCGTYHGDVASPSATALPNPGLVECW